MKQYLDERRQYGHPGGGKPSGSLGCTGVKRPPPRPAPRRHGGYSLRTGRSTTSVPVQHPADDPNSDIVTTHFEYHSMESNLLKLDMLGHDDPTMIRMLEDLTGVNARTDTPLDDKDTMSIFPVL